MVNLRATRAQATVDRTDGPCCNDCAAWRGQRLNEETRELDERPSSTRATRRPPRGTPRCETVDPPSPWLGGLLRHGCAPRWRGLADGGGR